VLATQGPVDILVNNAGVVSGRPLLELTDEHIERTFRVNTLALFWTTRAFLPAMVARGSGHLVTVASAAGLIGSPRETDYAASKFAAVGFTEALRMELRRSAPGVKTTVVRPFYIDTGMFAGVKTRFPLLLPILKEGAVTERILRAVQHDVAQLDMPWMVRTLPLMRMLPVWAFDGLADFFGITMAMDEFMGRQVPRS
jgi:all-trans-retinol dehydrogenase (NAD+)